VFARVTRAQIDTETVSVEDALRRFQAAAMPSLQEQHGYRGMCVLAGEEGEVLLVSFWATEASAHALEDGGWYFAVLRDFITLLQGEPGRATYGVLAADLGRATG
jgi:hypothetical protein